MGRFERPAQGRTAPEQVYGPAVTERTEPVSRKAEKKPRRQRKPAKLFVTLYSIFLGLLLFGFCTYLYLFCTTPSSSPLTRLSQKFQNYMITQSRESHSYQWVQYFFPLYIRQPYIDADLDARYQQKHFHSEQEPSDVVIIDPSDGSGDPESTVTDATEETEPVDEEKLAFYELFYELDQTTMESYLARHPSALANGYGHIYINEAGLDDDGTDIYTTKGEQVLAIDAYNQILLIRVSGSTYRGVLATAKDPAMLHLYVAAGISNSSYYEGYGQTAGTIASKHNGILAITASGFTDEGGVGTGGAVAGYCMSDGERYGFRHREYGCKRLELRENNWLYLMDIGTNVSSEVTDYMEFEPGMVADGNRLPNYSYTAENPRACLGQTDKGEILMLAIEGRQPPITGCSVSICADIMIEHRCITAMNMDGGTSAMLWFDGEPVIRCSNSNTPQGRYLPNAWVYVRKD